jgi:hypothetical protein
MSNCSLPYPGYRITLQNLGSKGVSNVHVQSYRGQDKALSGLKRTEDGRPMMQPGATYTFDMNLASGRANASAPPGTWTPSPLDVIEFNAVRWDDGTYEGNPPYPHADVAIESDSGRRLQLRRIVDALRAVLAEQTAGADVLASAKSRIGSLRDAEPDQLDAAKLAMRSTKATVTEDIARFERDNVMASDGVVRKWMTTLLNRYEEWLARLSAP